MDRQAHKQSLAANSARHTLTRYERDALARIHIGNAFASGRAFELLALRLGVAAGMAHDDDIADALALAAIAFLQCGRA